MTQTTKTVLVTGGYGDIGIKAAGALAQSEQGWRVVIAGRDCEKAKAAARAIGPSADGMGLNLAALSEVRAFAKQLRNRIREGQLPPLHAVVCCAGMQTQDLAARTTDGFEVTFGTNHLGHFLLVNLLLKDLVAPARVIMVSSGTHDPQKVEGRRNAPDLKTADLAAYPELPAAPKLSGLSRYSTSKLANLMVAYELDRRLRRSGRSTPAAPITANAFDPGRGADHRPATRLSEDVETHSNSALAAEADGCADAATANLIDGANAPLGTFSSRISLCHVLGLVTDIEHHDLNILRRVRNDFAHDIHTSFETQSVIDRCATLKLKAHDYDSEKLGEVRVGASGQFRTAAVGLIMNLTNRAHYVGERRCVEAKWPY